MLAVQRQQWQLPAPCSPHHLLSRPHALLPLQRLALLLLPLQLLPQQPAHSCWEKQTAHVQAHMACAAQHPSPYLPSLGCC
jgi:hypothetical protein